MPRFSTHARGSDEPRITDRGTVRFGPRRMENAFWKVMPSSGSTWVTLLSAAALGAAASLSEGPFHLRLLHTNDMHARFEQVSRSAGKCSEQEAADGLCYGGFARVQAALAEEFARAERENVSVLSLNAGDTYQGTVWYTVYKWRVVSHFLKMLKIDAMALGNHEFDDGIKGLTPFLNDVGIPVLAANIDFSGEPEMTRTPIRRNLTMMRAGRKIGVVGYLTPDTADLADVGKLKFEDEIESLKREAQSLKSEGVDIVMALGHSGYEVDLRIAREVPDVDVVVGGHSHTFLYSGSPPDSEKPADVYPVMVTQKSGRKVAMVQAFAFTKYLGVLDLWFDEKGELLEGKGNPIVLNNSVPEDPAVLGQVYEWKSRLNSTLRESIGKTAVVLDASLCRFYECNLGNLIADAYVYHAVKNNRGSHWTKAAIAIQQAGGIRASINTTVTGGEITREDVITTMPFFSSVSVVRLKGKHLLEALEWSVARYDPTHRLGRGEFLQVSGLRVKFTLRKPQGSRVVSVKVRCGRCQTPMFRQLDLNEDYDILMPTFLLKGGDKFVMFKQHGVEIDKFSESDTEIVMKYIGDRGFVYDGMEDRIEIEEGIGSGSFNLKPNFKCLFVILINISLLIK